MSHLLLFLIFCKFALLCFGGGYMLVPLLISEFVDQTHSLSLAEFGNLVSIAQVTPGPIAINSATYVGFLQGGFLGAAMATTGIVLPTLILSSIAVKCMQKWKGTFLVSGILGGTRIAAVALIAFAVSIFLGMSVFTAPIPWGELIRIFIFRLPNLPANFSISWSGLAIFLISCVLIFRTKIPLTLLIVGSALAGMLFAFLL